MFRWEWVLGTLWFQFRLDDQWVTLRIPTWPVSLLIMLGMVALALVAVDWAFGHAWRIGEHVIGLVL